MLAIRLARTGRNKYPTYRIVAAESARAATGKFVAVLGHYNPHTKELVLKKEEATRYLSHGAQPSNSVIKLLQREKIELPKWVSLKTKSKSPKKAAQEKAATAAEAAAQSEYARTEAPEAGSVVAEEAQANAETLAESTDESAAEDTAAGEESQAVAADAVEAAGDVAVAEAKAEAEAANSED